MKYDFELDLNTSNSLSIISKKITPNSTVLEFGPAAGRLTKYLNEKLNCKVYIVEIDNDAAENASQYAEGTIIDNIENYKWLNIYKDIQFDYIIFADVLEHLYLPEIALAKSIELLKNEGSVLVSVPNIAHNSVVIDLLNNKFEYKKIGLLDDTHIRFFTYNSLLNMIHTSGLETFNEQATYMKVEETEFDNYYDNLPKSLHLYMKNRPFGEVYQYVFELKKKSYFEKSLKKIKNIKINPSNYYYQIYNDYGSGYQENLSTINNLTLNQTHFEIDLDQYDRIQSLRFDPINTNAIIRIDNIRFQDNDDNIFELHSYITNASFIYDNYYVFGNQDPQIILKDIIGFKKIIIDLTFQDVDFDIDNYMLFFDKLEFYKNELILKSNELKISVDHFQLEELNSKKELDNITNEMDTIKQGYNNKMIEIENNKNIIASLQGELENKNIENVNLKNETIGLSQKINQIENSMQQLELNSIILQNELNDIYKSIGWKSIKKIKNIKNKLGLTKK